MKRLTIAIDIDDVLADNAAGFVAFSNERWGTNLTPGDYDEHWAKVWQVENNEVERRARAWHASGVIKTYRHNEEALPVLQKLSSGHDLLIVTSRRLSAREDTLAWIHRHYPGVFLDETIHFAGIWDNADDTSIHRTKASVVESLGADYLIDDQLKHCLAVAESGRKAILFGDYAWNQTGVLPENVMRLADWAAVGRHFEDAA